MRYYYYSLAAGLAAGCILYPTSVSLSVALFSTLVAHVAELYLVHRAPKIDAQTQGFHAEFQEIKNEVLKLKAKAEQESLGKAFTRGNV